MVFVELLANNMAYLTTGAAIVVPLLVTYVLGKFALKYKRVVDLINKIPGPELPAWGWLLGHLPIILKELKKEDSELGEEFLKIVPKYMTPEVVNAGLVRVWAGPVPVVACLSPESAEVVLSNNDQLLDKALFYEGFAPWLGDGILIANGHKWNHARKLMAPTFHFKILDDFVPKMNASAKDFMKYLNAERVKSKDNVLRDIAEPVMLCALDNITNTVMGVKIDPYTQKSKDYSEAVNEANLLFFKRLVNPLNLIKPIYNATKDGKVFQEHVKTVHDFTHKIVATRKAEIMKGLQDGGWKEEKHMPMLDTLINYQRKGMHHLTDQDIQEEVTTIIFDGHETTGWGMTWAVWLIGLHPEVQAKLREEIDAIFGDDFDKELDQDDIRKLHYLDCTIKEAQRMIPSVPLIARKVNKDTDINGYTVPAGSSVLVATYFIHRDERHWPEPEKFLPERFAPENSKDRHSYAHLPFSAGARNCLGQKVAVMEVKIVMANLLRHFNITSMDTREQVQVSPSVISRTRKPLRMKLEPRF
ncbi:Cytochrome P450 4V2 [Halotydeus destructor]|nr:Cytochrome P450 4V2 [Halotydeus destructor]